MIEGFAYIYVSSADLANQALSTIRNVGGVDDAYLVTGTWDIHASITTGNWEQTMAGIRGAPGVYAISPFQA